MYRYENSADGEYDLTMYVPTRGRPENALRLQDQFFKTTVLNSRILFVLSDNDDSLQDYLNCELSEFIVVSPNKPGFVSPANLGYLADRKTHYSYSVGFMGDDHMPRTYAWDEICVNELLQMGGGYVYGDDKLQGEAIPTSIIMSSEIPLTLGYITLPSLRHLYADNFWLDMGRAINKIKYLPNVVIEHMHPAAGKAQVDAGYEFSSSYSLDQLDKKEYERYLKEDLESDARIVSSALRRVIL